MLCDSLWLIWPFSLLQRCTEHVSTSPCCESICWDQTMKADESGTGAYLSIASPAAGLDRMLPQQMRCRQPVTAFQLLFVAWTVAHRNAHAHQPRTAHPSPADAASACSGCAQKLILEWDATCAAEPETPILAATIMSLPPDIMERVLALLPTADRFNLSSLSNQQLSHHMKLMQHFLARLCSCMRIAMIWQLLAMYASSHSDSCNQCMCCLTCMHAGVGLQRCVESGTSIWLDRARFGQHWFWTVAHASTWRTCCPSSGLCSSLRGASGPGCSSSSATVRMTER